MKNILFAAVMMIVTCLAATAQPQRERRDIDPETAATQQTERMTELLNLSEEQIVQVKAIALEQINKRDEMRKEMGESQDREAMRENMKAMREASNAQYKEVLTEEQYAQFLKSQEEQQKNRGQKNNNGRGRRSSR